MEQELERSLNDKLMQKMRKEWILKIVFSVVLFTITYTIALRLTSLSRSDFAVHLKSAKQIHFRTVINYLLTHVYVMWHMLVRIFYKVFAMPMDYAAAVVSGFANVASYLVAERIIKKYQAEKSELIAFCLMLVNSIYIPWFSSKQARGINTWHNPTNPMTKPFAICCFFMVLGFLDAIHKHRKIEKKQYIILSVLIFLSVAAKPSFIQAFIPGLGAYLLFLCVKNRFRNFRQYFYLCLTFVPGVLLVFYQAMHFWGPEGTRGGIGIEWLKVMSHGTPNVWISQLLVLCFPLLYLVLNVKTILKKADVQLSIFYFVAAWLEKALLYEKVGTYHGNFTWASHIAAFVLFMLVTIYFVKDIQSMRINDKVQVIKNSVLLTVFLIHLLCGSWYVYRMITQAKMLY